jgi:hypothetical protein
MVPLPWKEWSNSVSLVRHNALAGTGKDYHNATSCYTCWNQLMLKVLTIDRGLNKELRCEQEVPNVFVRSMAHCRRAFA